jgi:hypothetical protein
MQIYIPASLFGAYYHRRTLLLGHAPMNTLQGIQLYSVLTVNKSHITAGEVADIHGHRQFL